MPSILPPWRRSSVLGRLLLTAAVTALGLMVLSGAMAGLAEAGPEPTRILPASPATPTSAITRTWDNLGLYGGVVAAIAVETSHNAPTGTVFAGTTSGDGLYRSLDGGLTWSGSYTSSVQRLGVNDRDGIVWAISEQGVITSSDGGGSWQQVSAPINGWARMAVVNRVTVLGQGPEVARSLDGGASWDSATLPCSGCQVTAVALDTHTTRILVATQDEIYASPFSPLGFTTLSTGSGMADILSLAASPHVSGLLYAGTGDVGGMGVRHSLFQSSDGGATWSKAVDAGSRVGYIRFHPVLTDTLFFNGNQYDGTSVTPLGFGAGNSHFAIYPTAPYTMFGAIDQGMNRSTDGGTTFYPHNEGIDGVVVQDFAQNPRDLGLYFVNTKNGVGRTFDGGTSWDFPLGYVPGSPSQPVGSHFGGAAAAPYFDPAYSQRVFLGELYSEDYGDSTQSLGSPTSLRQAIEGSGCVNCFAFINSVAADPSDPLALVAGVGGSHNPTGGANVPHGGVWESGDGGASWSQHSSGYSASYGSLPYTSPVKLVAFASDGTAYASLGDLRDRTDFGGGMYGGVISRTAGGSWNLLATTTNPITAPVAGLAIDPNDPLHIWAGTAAIQPGHGGPGAHLYRSTDGGLSWQTRTPAAVQGDWQAIAVHPNDSQKIFAAAGREVYYSDDAGATWVQLPPPPTGRAATAEAIQRILLPILPPSSVENLTGTVSGGNITLNWTAPADVRFQGVIVRGDGGAAPRTSLEGTLHDTVISTTTSSSFSLPTDPYYLSVIPYDAEGRYGVGTVLEVNGSSVSATGRVVLARALAQEEEGNVYVGTATGLYRMPLEGLDEAGPLPPNPGEDDPQPPVPGPQDPQQALFLPQVRR